MKRQGHLEIVQNKIFLSKLFPGFNATRLILNLLRQIEKFAGIDQGLLMIVQAQLRDCHGVECLRAQPAVTSSVTTPRKLFKNQEAVLRLRSIQITMT